MGGDWKRDTLQTPLISPLTPRGGEGDRREWEGIGGGIRCQTPLISPLTPPTLFYLQCVWGGGGTGTENLEPPHLRLGSPDVTFLTGEPHM